MEEKWVLHNFYHEFIVEEAPPTPIRPPQPNIKLTNVKIVKRQWHEMIDKTKSQT